MKPWKILSPVAICLVLILLLVPTEANAAKSGDYTYTVSYGMATITKVDYDIRGNITIPATLGGYPVAEIGEWAFLECEELTGVTIPEGIEYIGDAAFEGCYKLKTVSIPASATTISGSAFDFCPSLTGIWVNAGNAKYSSDTNGVLFNKSKTTLIKMPEAFSGHYRIPDSVTVIDNAAFRCCEKLETVTIPSSVYTIGFSAFEYCSGLTSVYIPSEVYTIEQSTFAYCTSLEIVGIGNGVKKIGYGAFTDCNKLKNLYYCGTTSAWRSVTILGGNERLHTVPTYCESGYIYDIIDGQAIITDDDTSLNGDITIPSTRAGCPVVAIGRNAFSFNSKITSLKIPDSVTTVGEGAVHACDGLTQVTLGNNVTSVEANAFAYCSNLSVVTVGSSPVSFGEDAFILCNENMDVYISDIAAWCRSTFADEGANPLRGNLYLNGELVKTLVIPDSVTAINTYAFENCTSPTSLVVGKNVTTIGKAAFISCTGLEQVTLGSRVETIGEKAFEGCTGLKQVTLGSGVKTVHEGAFFDCWNLTDVYYASTRSDWKKISIGENNKKLTEATLHCKSDPEDDKQYFSYRVENGKAVIIGVDPTFNGDITVPAEIDGYPVIAIAEEAFYDCSEITSVTFPETLQAIGRNVFYGCSKLKCMVYGNAQYLGTADNPYYALILTTSQSITQCTIHPDTKLIAAYAFYNCTSMKAVTIPNNVEFLGEAAFMRCSGLKQVTLSSRLKTIDASTFYGCSGLPSVSFPDSVTTIGEAAFYNCTGLEQVTFGSSVETIDTSAFSGCSGLLFVLFPDSVTTIGNAAFYGCNSLSAVTVGKGLSWVGTEAFLGCWNLTDVFYAGTRSDWGKISIGVSNGTLTGATLHCQSDPEGDKQYFSYRVEDGNAIITDVDSSFNGGITVPAEMDGYPVTAIDAEAFNGCSKITAVTLPETLQAIGRNAFYGCSKLEFKVYDNAKYLGTADNPYYALITATSQSITQCTIHPDTKLIAAYAFNNCTSMTAVTIPDDLAFIGDYAFYWCYKLTEVTIPNSVTEIGDNAFYYCTRLGSVTIGKRVTYIGSGAFNYCNTLQNVHYAGTETQWEKINIGTGNSKLLAATLTFNVKIPCTECSFGPYVYVDGTYHVRTCKNCDKTQSATHSWNSGVVTKQPTCAETGVRTYTCTVCSGTRTETVAKTDNHSWNGGAVTKQPTCAETGIRTYTCTVCKGTKTETLAKTSDHSYGSVTEVDDQTHSHSCMRCGRTENVPHNWDAGTVLQEPTLETTGLRKYTCTDCSATKTEVMPMRSNGDMDGNDKVTTDDAVYLLLHVLFGGSDYPIATPDKDLNNDGKVGTDDAVYLLLHVMFGAEDYPL